jgi:hypothetical protein
MKGNESRDCFASLSISFATEPPCEGFPTMHSFPLLYAIPAVVHTRFGRACLGTCILIAVAAGLCMNVQANTVQNVKFVTAPDGKLDIQVNVDGEARQMNPRESSGDGVYALNLNAVPSSRLKQQNVIMDANGEYIGRLEQANGKLSLVVPGLAPENARVTFQSSGKGGASRSRATANGGTLLGAAAGLHHVAPTFQLAESTPIAAGHSYGSASHQAPVTKNAPPVSGTRANAPYPERVTSKSTAAGAQRSVTGDANKQATSHEESSIPETATDETLQDFTASGAAESPNTSQATEPQYEWENDPLSMDTLGWERDVETNQSLLLPPDAGARFLQLPWEDETWLKARIQAAEVNDARELQMGVWSSWLNVTGGSIALLLIILALRYPQALMGLKRFMIKPKRNAPAVTRKPGASSHSACSAFSGIRNMIQEQQMAETGSVSVPSDALDAILPQRPGASNTTVPATELKPFYPAFNPADDLIHSSTASVAGTPDFKQWLQGVQPVEASLHAETAMASLPVVQEAPSNIYPKAHPSVASALDEPMPAIAHSSAPIAVGAHAVSESRQTEAQPSAKPFAPSVARPVRFTPPRFMDVRAKRMDQQQWHARHVHVAPVAPIEPFAPARASFATTTVQPPATFQRLNRLRFGV